MSCTSPWENEKKPGEGWSYDEPGMTYDAAIFDTLVPSYNALGEASVWAEEHDTADFAADWSYEHRNGEGWLFNEPGMTYDAELFNGFQVFYNFIGLVTEWSYDERIEGCAPVYFFFMDGEEYLLQTGEQKEFQ